MFLYITLWAPVSRRVLSHWMVKTQLFFDYLFKETRMYDVEIPVVDLTSLKSLYS